MGTLTSALKRLFSATAVFFSRLSAFFSKEEGLHSARFARVDELSDLIQSEPTKNTSLLLGMGRFSRLLSVRPSQHRRELGNLLVVAPTRGGKGLLATSQLLTWPHSVIVNDIKGGSFFPDRRFQKHL